MAEGPHDASWITLLGVALDNVETYGNLVISRLGKLLVISLNHCYLATLHI
jgi:hypothetical protein